MNKLPTFERAYARWNSLRQIIDIAVDTYEYTSDELVDTHFGGDPGAFADYLATGPKNGGMSIEQLRELFDLILNTSTTSFELGYEDSDFLTRVRSHLCDALAACLNGDIEAAAGATDKAYRTLDFMTYRRKRTDRRDFHKPFAEEKRRFEVLTARTSRLARALDKEAVSV